MVLRVLIGSWMPYKRINLSPKDQQAWGDFKRLNLKPWVKVKQRKKK